MDRRLFLRSLGLGASALCISDRFLLRAERYLEHHNTALLKTYSKVQRTLFIRECGILCWGDPYAEPIDIPTNRQYYVDWRGWDLEEVIELYGSDGIDQKMDEWDYREAYWNRNESPEAIAYNKLGGMNIGPLQYGEDEEPVGELEFMDGPSIGNDSLLVTVPDELSLSCLQWRLEQLGCPINVRYSNA